MARHNREANGADQQGYDYTISYQPDWLRQIKVTRQLETGRQSTKTLFVNPDDVARQPGQQVRTSIRCEAQGLAFDLVVADPSRVVRRVIVETEAVRGAGAGGERAVVHFTIDPHH